MMKVGALHTHVLTQLCTSATQWLISRTQTKPIKRDFPRPNWRLVAQERGEKHDRRYAAALSSVAGPRSGNGRQTTPPTPPNCIHTCASDKNWGKGTREVGRNACKETVQRVACEPARLVLFYRVDP
jgi:hypothetical protein